MSRTQLLPSSPVVAPYPVVGGRFLRCPMLMVVDDSYDGPPLSLRDLKCGWAKGQQGAKAWAAYRRHYARKHWRPFYAETEAVMAYLVKPPPELGGSQVYARVSKGARDMPDVPEWWPFGPEVPGLPVSGSQPWDDPEADVLGDVREAKAQAEGRSRGPWRPSLWR